MSDSTEQDMILYYAEHPVEFSQDICGFEPTDQQKEFFNSLPIAIKKRLSISIKAGHGVGKSASTSIAMLWFLATRPFPKVVATAPTGHQLNDVLWSELSRWYRTSKINGMFDWRKESFRNKTYPEEWFALARSSRTPEGLQGFHGKALMFIVDECSGVSDEILDVIEGTQTEEGCLIVYLGNPTKISGGFYDSFNSKRKFYITHTFSCLDSPRVKKEYGERIASKYGIDSDIYRVRVLGQFPKAEPDSIIPLSVAEAACIRELVENPFDFIEFGIDVARFGNDETIIFKREGLKYTMSDVLFHNDTTQVAGKFIERRLEIPDSVRVVVNVDDSGVGGGVTDQIRKALAEGLIKNVEVHAVNNGTRAVRDDRYRNRVSEMWMEVKDILMEAIIPNDNDLIGQLSTRKYHINTKAQFEIETKDRMKERGLTSPDRADALVLASYSLIYRNSMHNIGLFKPLVKLINGREGDTPILDRIELYKRQAKMQRKVN